MSVSIVVPFYNEEQNILALAEELSALKDQVQDLEVLFVDDGSSDGTAAKIREAAADYPCIRGIFCPKNQGQSSAMLHGLHAAAGEVMVTIDGDLQNNPADIPRFVEELGDADALCGYRANRQDTWSRKTASKIANWARNKVTHDGLRDTGCSLKVFKKHCVNDLPWVDGAHRFMGAYFKLNGRTIREAPADHRARQHGESKYTNLGRTPRGIYDLIGFAWYRKRHVTRLAVEKTS